MSILVNARSYERIALLYDEISKHFSNRIERDYFVDEIYKTAAKDYSDLEFIRLRNIIPIELNRFLLNLQTKSDRIFYEFTPLLHCVASFGNLTLVKYLIEEEGADINRAPPLGLTLMEVVDKAIGRAVGLLCISELSNEPISGLFFVKDYLSALATKSPRQ